MISFSSLESDEPRWRQILLDHVVPLSLYLGAAVALLWSNLGSEPHHLTSTSDTALQSVWAVWWVQQALSSGEWLFFTDRLFAPSGTSLYHHPLGLTTTIPAAILAILGLSHTKALAILAIFGFAFTGWIQSLIVRKFEVERWIAIFAGAAFAFGPFHAGQTLECHAGLIGTGWLSLYLLTFLRLLQQPGLGRGVVSGLALTLVSLTDWYLFIVGVIIAFVILIAHSVRSTKRVLSGGLLTGIAAMFFAALLTSGPLIARTLMLLWADDLTLPPPTWSAVGDAESILLPNGHMLTGQLLDGWTQWTAPASATSQYVGVVLFGTTLWAVAEKKNLSLTLLVMALVFVLFSLGPYLRWGGEVHLDIPLPARLVDRYVPFLGVLWRPSTLAVGAAWCLSLTAAMGLEEIRDDIGTRRFFAIPIALLALVELAPFPSDPVALPASTALQTLADDGERAGTTVIDTHSGTLRTYHQTLHGLPLVNGFAERYRLQDGHEIEQDPVLGQILDPPGLRSQARERVDREIDFDWGSDSPIAGVANDGFDVRWRGQVLVPFDGAWRFFVEHDGGIRLRINGRSIIDSWLGTDQRVDSGEAVLSSGWQSIELFYIHREGAPVVRLRWSRGDAQRVAIPEEALRVEAENPGLRGRYFGRTEGLPEGGREAALTRLRELRVRTIIKPQGASTSFEELLGLMPRREGELIIIDVPAALPNSADDSDTPESS